MEDNRLMKATTEWMAENYDRLNKELFGGQLDKCDFGIFTSGKGSQGRILGLFELTNRDIFVDRLSRNMYFNGLSNKVYIKRDNFVVLCRPCIKLNGNYSGTEEALLNTLVHEMCHYFDYMYGNCPKQCHGPRFRQIAQMVSNNSGGRFTITRLASAEKMSNYKLDKEMQEKRDKRIANKKSRAMAIFVYQNDGSVRLTLVSQNNTDVLNRIIKAYSDGFNRGKASEIIVSNDAALIEMLFQNRYRKLMRTWRYWEVGKASWIDTVKNYDYKTVYKDGNMEENNKRIGTIVEDVVREYVNDIGKEDDVRIGGINLGIESPLEDGK